MIFGMKNVISTFLRTMTKVFGEYMDKFLKVFVDDLSVHNTTWETFGAFKICVSKTKGNKPKVEP
jgi:hypothetical protein